MAEQDIERCSTYTSCSMKLEYWQTAWISKYLELNTCISAAKRLLIKVSNSQNSSENDCTFLGSPIHDVKYVKFVAKSHMNSHHSALFFQATFDQVALLLQWKQGSWILHIFLTGMKESPSKNQSGWWKQFISTALNAQWYRGMEHAHTRTHKLYFIPIFIAHVFRYNCASQDSTPQHSNKAISKLTIKTS